MRIRAVAFRFRLIVCCLSLACVSRAAAQEDPIPRDKPAAGGWTGHAQCGEGATEISVFAAPGKPPAVATLKCGEMVGVLRLEEGFYRIKTTEGKVGYVSHWFVVEDTSPGTNSSETQSNDPDKPAAAGKNGVGYPMCAYCPPPSYSPEARSKKFQGVVVLKVLITADGRATDISVVRGPGYGLEEKAIEAVRQWKFKPAIGPDKKPVPTIIQIEVAFHLLN